MFEVTRKLNKTTSFPPKIGTSLEKGQNIMIYNVSPLCQAYYTQHFKESSKPLFLCRVSIVHHLLPVKILQIREIKQLAQGHTAGKIQNSELNTRFSDSSVHAFHSLLIENCKCSKIKYWKIYKQNYLIPITMFPCFFC